MIIHIDYAEESLNPDIHICILIIDNKKIKTISNNKSSRQIKLTTSRDGENWLLTK